LYGAQTSLFTSQTTVTLTKKAKSSFLILTQKGTHPKMEVNYNQEQGIIFVQACKLQACDAWISQSLTSIP